MRTMRFYPSQKVGRSGCAQARQPRRRLQLERLEDRVVPSLPDGTILVCTGPSAFSSLNQSSFPTGIIGVNPTTGAQTVISTGGLFSLPTYVTEAPNQQLYVSDLTAFGTGAVFRVDPNTGQQSLVAKGGMINGPNVLVWVNGYIYVANTGDSDGTVHSIVKIDPNTGVQTLVTNGSGGGFSVPVGIVPALGDNVYVADEPGNYTGTDPGKLWEINLDTGVQTIISSNNNTQGTLFNHPVDVAVDGSGTIYIANTGGPANQVAGSLFRINPQTGAQTLITSFGPYSGIDSMEVTANGTLFAGAISAGVVPAQLIAVNPQTGAQAIVSTGGNLSQVEGIRAYHATSASTATTVTVTSSVNAAVFGQGITFTATVSASGASGTPTGTVQFAIDGVKTGNPINISNNGGVATATFNAPSLAAGTHTLTASYSGDTIFLSNTGNFTQTVNKANTSTAVTSAVSASVFSQMVTFSATIVVSSPVAGTPTGAVQFSIDGSNAGSPVSLSSNAGLTTATFTITSMAVGTHTVTASYSGDSNFTGSASSALTQTVSKASTAAALVVSANPSVFGQNITLEATVSAVAPGAGTPTGTVQFIVDGSNAGSPVTVSSASGVTTASFSTATLAVGVHTIAASYSGDSSFLGSMAAALAQMVGKAGTNTALVSAVNPSVTGQGIAFTATITPTAPGAGSPTGTVQFMVDGSPAGSPINVSTGGGVTTASFNIPSLAVGNHTIAASYSGDGNFTGSSAVALTQTVTKAATSTVISSSVNPAVTAQNLTFTATISVTAPGGGTPTGTVQFVIDGSNAGSPVAVAELSASSATASFSTTSLAVGTHVITASYSGDGSFAASAATALTQTVGKAGTTAVVTSSASPSVSGQGITITATVTPSNGMNSVLPTGMVQFLIDGSPAGSPVAVAGLSSGSATASFTTAGLALGTHTIAASYSGDGNFTASTASLFTQTVTKASTSTVVSASVNPAAAAQSVTFTATVSVAAPGAGTPTGTVQFLIDGSPAGSPVAAAAMSTSSATASFSTTSLAIGAHTIAASYSGDASFTASSGSLTGGQTITNKSLSNTVLSSSVNSSVFGQNVNFTATVTAGAGSGAPTGTVQFVIDGTNFGVPVSLTGGVATSSTISSLAVSNHSIQAIYSGDNAFASSTGALTQTVAKAATATLFGSAPAPAVSGQSISFTAIVSVLSPGGGTPTGTIQFMIDGANAGSPINVSSSGGLTTASFSTSSLAPGAHTVTASYSGDGNFAASIATVITQTAAKASTSTILAASANPSVTGQAVSFTATISPVAPGAGVPTGTVQFIVDGSTAGGPVSVSSAGGVVTASFSATSLAVGTHTIAASYSGDGSFTSSLAAAVTQTMAKANTSTVVSSSANASVSGQGLTFTASVGVTAPGSGTPTGTVQFVIDGANFGSPVAVLGGIATSGTIASLSVSIHTIQASYSGDSSFTTSTAALTQTVNQAGTTTLLTSSANPTVSGRSVTFIATVGANAPGAGTPTGTVQFVIDGTNFGSPVNLTSGIATSTAINSLSVSGHTIKAIYSGDTSFSAGTGTFTQTVAKAGTTTTLSSPAIPSAFGQVVTFTATVSATPPGVGSPTGTVQFMIDGSNAGSPVSLGATGGVRAASFSTASLAVGTHLITAVYSGDGNFTTSMGTFTQTVGKAGTSTALSASISSSVSGQNITFTATVSASAPGGGTPTGTVQFLIDGSNAGNPVNLSSTGGVVTASFSMAPTGGTHTITASYSGDSNFGGSIATALTQTVGKASTSMLVVSAANPAVYGQSITFTATIGAPNGINSVLLPSGTVQFVIDGSNAGSPVTVSGTGGVATASFSTASLAPGTHEVLVSYSGDSNFTGSTASALTQTVGKASTSTAMSASGNPSVFGQSIAFTATVSVTAPGSGMPTGTVQFMVDGTNLGSPVGLAGGVATSSAVSGLPAGSHTVQAIYSGDSNFASGSGTLAQAVKPAGTTIVITSSANPVLSGQSVSFTATVGITAPGTGTPTGTVQFVVDGSNAGSPVSVISAGGVVTASFNTASLAVGTHTIAASYSGDSSFAPSSGTLTAGQTVLNKPNSTTTLSSAINPSLVGQNVSFTATVTANTGSGTPTGTVQFVIDGSNAGSPVPVAELSAGSATASFSTASLTVGAHTIVASYSGDANFAGSSGTLAGGQTVSNKPASTTVISSSANPAVFGQSVVFTAAVTAASGSGTPSGTVQFLIDGTKVGNPVSLTTGGVAASGAVSTLSVSSHTIQAVYSGDSSFSGSTGSLTQTVTKSSTSTVVSSSLNPAIAGQTITFTATVSPLSGINSVLPSGTIQFLIDGANAASPQTVTSSGGLVTATFTTTSLATGIHAISASYSGDSNFTASTDPFMQTVNKAHTVTALSASAGSSVFGQSVSFTAMVGVILPGGGSPTGTVQFMVDGSNTGGPVGLSSTSGGIVAASLNIASLTAGTHTLTASYSGDSSFTSSTANTLTLTVARASTSTALGTSANPSTFGQSLSFTATVTANAGSSAATGAVQFLIDGNNAGSPIPVVNTAGSITASFSPASLSAGSHVISASYSGDADFAASIGVLTQSVDKVNTGTTVTASTNNSVTGQTLTFTAAVTASASGGTPTGTIQFLIDGTNAGSPVSLVGGSATTATSLSAGSHTIQAIYSGDVNFTGSTQTLTQTVGKAGTTTLVSSSANSLMSGQSVTFTATVTITAPGAGTPTGTVQFVIDGSNAGGSVSVSNAGGVVIASFSTSLAAGTHTIAASYSGDSSFAGSLATAITQTVTEAATNTVVASSANAPVFGQGIAFTATVSAAAPSSGTPTGTVQFMIDGTNFGGPVALIGGDATSATISSLSVSNHTIQAVYSGDSSFSTSTAALTQAVSQAATSTSVGIPANPLVFGQSITLTATISVTTPGAGTPTGTVQFLIDGANAGSPVSVMTNGGVTTASLITTSLAVSTHTISARYSGDSNFSSSTASNLTQTVGKAGTTTVVSSSASPAVSGQGITFTATISAMNGMNSVLPTGTVQFLIDGNPAGSPVAVTELSSGSATASFTTAGLALGTHTLAASYSGDGNFTASTASLFTQTVAKASTSTLVSASVNPAIVGQSITLTATVNVAAPGGGTPTGTVQFLIDGSAVGSPVTVAELSASSATASFSTASLAIGAHTVTASYSGDANFTPSSGSLTGGQTITGKPLSSTALSSSANSSVFGQNITFTATVTANGGNVAPTGTVQFVIDGTSYGAPVSLTGGVATTSAIGSLSVSTHTIQAIYSGDATFAGSTGSLTQTVTQDGTSTVVTSGLNPSVFGQPVTFTATISPSNGINSVLPTGTVQFMIDGTSLGTPVSVQSSGGAITASFSTPGLAVGTHAVTASYSGDSNFSSSTATAVTQTVGKSNTNTALSSSVGASVFGQSVTFTATISPVNAINSAPPSGTVQFIVDGSNAGVAELSASSATAGGVVTASFSTTSLAVGTHTIAASYSGDGSFAGSSATSLTQTVTKAMTGTVVVSSANPLVSGQSVTFTATVTAIAPGSGPLTGTVQLLIDGSNAGSPVSLNQVGGVFSSSFSTASLTAGTHIITASYSGDPNFTGSTAAAFTQTVTKAGTTTVASTSANPAVFGQSLTFTATVAGTMGGAGTPTGTVQFMIDGTAFGSPVNLTGGVATSVAISSLSANGHTVRAVYSGDSSFTGSTGLFSQTVTKATTSTLVRSSMNQGVSGQSITFTATISPVAPGAGTPTGTVQFLIDGATIGSPVKVTNAGGVATASFTSSSVAVGIHTITASYSGDNSFAGSTATDLTQTVNQAATSTLVLSSANPSVSGQNVTFTATISVIPPGAGTPSGTVQFVLDGANFGSPVRLTGGVAISPAVPSLTVGNHTIGAIYSGDSSFAGSSGTLAQTINQGLTTTSLSSSLDSPVSGQAVTFTATVSVTGPGSGTPTGVVQFLIDGSAAGSPVPVALLSASSATATLTTASLAVGSHTITASYNGDSNFAGSVATPFTQTVGKAGTSTLVSSSVSPSVFGQSLVFTAVVSASDLGSVPPSGTVQFQIDGTDFATPVALTAGVARSAALSGLSVGEHTIQAIYSGDPNFTTSTGSLTQEVLNQTASILVISAFPTPTVAGAPDTFTVTVEDSSGNIVPGYRGTIHFSSSDSSASLPPDYTFTAADNGVHTFNAVFRTAGTQSLTATDIQDNLSGSQSDIAVTAAAADHFLVTPSVETTVAGTPFDFTITVQDAYDNTVTGYTGTVGFSSADPYGATLPAAYTFTAADGGVHTFSAGAMLYTAGGWNITATDTSNPTLTGSASVFVVAAGPDHFLITPSVTTTVAGSPFDFTVTVQDAYDNTVTGYTGTVGFFSADPYGASLPTAYSFTAADGGVHTFSAGAMLYTAGGWNITATDTSNPTLTGSASVFVVAAGPDHFLITPSVTTTVAGSPFDFTVTVEDAYDNTVTGYTGTVGFFSADPYGASLPTAYTFTAADSGVHTFSGGATLYTVGTWDITANDTSNSALTGSAFVQVTPAAASHFLILAPAGVVAGTPFDITIEAVDPYGNVDTNYITDPSGVVHFSTTDSDPGVILPPDFQLTAADQGVVTFAGGVTLFTPGDQTLMAVDTASGITDDGSAVVLVMAPGGYAPPRRALAPSGNFAGLLLAGEFAGPSLHAVATRASAASGEHQPAAAASDAAVAPQWLIDQIFALANRGADNNTQEFPAWNPVTLSGIADALSRMIHCWR
jgi:hypothetical protein